MYADLILYTEPRRPLINPRFDLFAWLDTNQIPPLFPAKVVDKIQLMLPEKCRQMEQLPKDTWEFVCWQVEEKGYAIVRSIDSDWFYWSVLADKYTLLNMVRLFA
jgi:hypothetical protein